MSNGSAVKITKRIKPCNCGCGGKDPHHQRKYTRTLHNIRDERGFVHVTAFTETQEYRRSATAQFPWGTERVVELISAWPSGATYVLGWYIARD